MLKQFFLFVFFFGILLCNSQNLLVFENLKNGKLLAYKLPLEAKCKLKNGLSKNVIIDSIQGDSLYYRMRNDKIGLCISLSSIKKIDNYNSEMNKLALKLGLTTIGTCFFVGITSYSIYYQEQNSSGSGDNSAEVLAELVSPFTAFFIIKNIYLGVKFLYTVSLDKWKFYGLQIH